MVFIVTTVRLVSPSWNYVSGQRRWTVCSDILRGFSGAFSMPPLPPASIVTSSQQQHQGVGLRQHIAHRRRDWAVFAPQSRAEEFRLLVLQHSALLWQFEGFIPSFSSLIDCLQGILQSNFQNFPVSDNFSRSASGPDR